MSRIIRSYIVDIVETDDVIYCDKDGHVTYNMKAVENELVRCKDCKHSDTIHVYVEGVVYCKWLHESCVKNGYCHRGERRGGDDE